MELKDIVTLREVAAIYNIPATTLKQRLQSKHRKLRNGIDYRKLGQCNLIVFSPDGVQKIIK